MLLYYLRSHLNSFECLADFKITVFFYYYVLVSVFYLLSMAEKWTVCSKKNPVPLCFFTQQDVVKKQYNQNKKQYSFRVFLRFRLAKIARIIRHNQLLFRAHLEEYFAILNQWRQKWSKLPDYWSVNREDLGTRLICFGSESKNGGTFQSFHHQEIGELLAK